MKALLTAARAAWNAWTDLQMSHDDGTVERLSGRMLELAMAVQTAELEARSPPHASNDFTLEDTDPQARPVDWA